MKKNLLTRSSQIRSTKKFKTSIKNFPSSKKEGTGLTTSNNKKVRNSSIISSSKPVIRKSVKNPTKKINEKVEENKRKSTVKKPTTKLTTSKLNSKKSLASNKSIKNNSKISKNQSNTKLKSKTSLIKKEKEKDTDNELKLNSKDSKIHKPSDIRSSEGFNSLGDDNEIINSKNIINNEENSKINNNPENNNKNIIPENINSKNQLLKQKTENEYNNLIKDSNDKIKGIYEFENENKENNNNETRLRNQKIETSDYITEKNKNMIRNLLFLLDRKSDDKKADKNIFRSQLNSLEKSEQNKLLETLYKNRREIFKIKWDEENNNINPSKANKKMTEIYNFVFEQKNNNINRINNINTIKKQQYPFYNNNKYYLDYINGVPPTNFENQFFPVKSNIFKNENNENNKPKLSHSYEPKYHVMKKNDLIVENRDIRYLNYNYGSLINTINNKLNGYISNNDFYQTFRKNNNNSMFNLSRYNYRDINRNRRIHNLFNSINASINSMTNYDKNNNYNLRNSI